MHSSQQKVRNYLDATTRSADWLVREQRPNGAFNAKASVGCVFKTGLALVTVGRLQSAARLMDYIASHCVLRPGEYGIKERARERPFGFYGNCYIVLSALRLGRFDVASPLTLNRLYRHQNRRGAFLATVGTPTPAHVDPLCTAMGGWLCLYTARHEQACKAGDYLLQLLTNQPELPDRFYFHSNLRTGKCITKFHHDEGITYFADRHRAKQHFYYSGAIMGFLADLYRATGETSYLQGALSMFDFESGMNPLGNTWPSKCKVGWGAALLFAATGKKEHRRLAEEVADQTFLKAQRTDGSWNAAQIPLSDDFSRTRTIGQIDLTAEFTFELCEISKALTATELSIATARRKPVSRKRKEQASTA